MDLLMLIAAGATVAQPSLRGATGAARDTRMGSVVIRAGLAGLPGTPRPVTAIMAAPGTKVGVAARAIARLTRRCMTSSTRADDDPVRCVVARVTDRGSCPSRRRRWPDFAMPMGTVRPIDDAAPDDSRRARVSLSSRP